VVAIPTVVSQFWRVRTSDPLSPTRNTRENDEAGLAEAGGIVRIRLSSEQEKSRARSHDRRRERA